MKAWIDAVIAALREPFPDAGLYDEKVKDPWEPGDFLFPFRITGRSGRSGCGSGSFLP
ncbi:hypothetical protein P7H16_09070 [Paenibacillus larvae]|nr:hypothetical protein [Paenibacillus larvae]MDT2247058.1 hypothetical protein [Paenibacillus larvae]MDT2256186.1 hypothetical protein [Paenibacillus larvae]